MNFGSTKLIKPTWYYSYGSKLKKKKNKQQQQQQKTNKQSGLTKCTVDVQHKNTIRAFIYKKKEHKSMIEKKNTY